MDKAYYDEIRRVEETIPGEFARVKKTETGETLTVPRRVAATMIVKGEAQLEAA